MYAVKMTRLLQFLEGPALLAVQRYETLPGGLAKALKTLKDWFGQPLQVVRASVESLRDLAYNLMTRTVCSNMQTWLKLPMTP